MSGVWPNMELVVRFGFGSHPTTGNPVWVDCTEFVRAVDGIDIVAGRPAGLQQIPVGSMTLVLDGADGRFDSENVDGPWYGLLVDGVPVQVGFRAPWDSPGSVSTLFRGFVASWPALDIGHDFPVELECFDVLGLMAQGDAPETALHGLLRSLDTPPDMWWTTGPLGWLDRVTGAGARPTGGLVEMDPLVDGDERTWGQEDPDGWGATTSRVDDLDHNNWTVVSAFVRLPPERAFDTVLQVRIPTVLCWQSVSYSGVDYDRLVLNIYDGHVSMSTTSLDSGAMVRTSSAWSTAEDSGTPSAVNLLDGRTHHIAVAMKAGHPNWNEGRLWVDGREVPVHLADWGQGAAALPIHGDGAQLRLGTGAGTSIYSGTPYQGSIDHLMIWSNFSGTADDAAELAREIHSAGRLAWAGDRLDQRVLRIASAMGVGGMVGTLDVSGITTLQGYRRGDPLELLQRVEDTEQGRVWVDRLGGLRFSSRRWWWADPQSTSVRAVFSDDDEPGAIPILASELVVERDSRRAVTVAQVTSEHGRMQTAEDEGSIAVRGRRNPVHLSGLLHPTDRQSRQIAEGLIWLYSTPRPRIRLSFRVDDSGPTIDDRTPEWLAAQEDEGALVEVRRRGRVHLGHLVLVEHRIDEHGWVVTIEVDTTRVGFDLWLADTSATDGPHVAAF